MSGEKVIATHRDGAEIHQGSDVCKQKSHELLDKMHLPRGILPLDDVNEFGYNAASGFVWLKQKKKKEHRFHAVSDTVSYDTEVTGFVEEHRMKSINGVKTKEILIWISISEIYIDPKTDPDKITVGTSSGISKSFPTSAFRLEEGGGARNGKK